MGTNNKWVIIINIMINLIANYIESKPNYSCPSYCGVNHAHIKVKYGFSNRILGTTIDIRLSGCDTDTTTDRRGCFKRKGKNTIRFVE